MTVEARVRGMTCQGCEEVVETAIDLVDAVESVQADRYDNIVRVEGSVEPEVVADKIEMAGYRVEDVGESLAQADGADSEEAEAEDATIPDEPTVDVEAEPDEDDLEE
ncbi:MAG: heavy-metal-associated domain-containing protein [Halobacteriota archaeon]